MMGHREFPITDEIRQLGFSRVFTMGKALFVYNARTDPIQCQYDKDDWIKTNNRLRKVLEDSHEFDKKTVDKFLVLLSQVWLKSVENDNEAAKSAPKREKIQRECIIEKINRVKAANAGISSEEWQTGLLERYEKLHKAVDDNIPEVWPGLEFELSILRILNLEGCTLPFIGIILGRPSSYKTLVINMLRKWNYTYYTDDFTAKAFVSHSTSVSEEQLEEIDMLPKIKNKLFLTPELSPMFTAKDEDLVKMLGIITRIADGHGYGSDSGAHGHRGYDEDIMFTWVGAAVDIPYKVYKVLGYLGPKLYFFRFPYKERTENELLTQMTEDFNQKVTKIETALFEYLIWFEIGPDLVPDKSSNLRKIRWNNTNDEEPAKKWIAKVAMLLSHLRCVAKTWETADSQGSDYAYSVSQREDPTRACTALTNLAKGHALSKARNYIALEDLSIVVKTVLSTAQIERVGLVHLVIDKKGELITPVIERSLNVAKTTALRTMSELKAIGLVDEGEKLVELEGGPKHVKRISLKPELKWLLSEEFKALRAGFEPVDNKQFMKEEELRKEKRTPTSIIFSQEQIDTFWRIFGDLEATASTDNQSTMTLDKNTVSGEKLRGRIVSSGKFYQSDAAMILDDMIKAGRIEQCAYDTYRRRE